MTQLTRATLAAVVVITLLWGLNWPIMKLSLREMTPLMFRAITMTGGVLMLAAFIRLRGPWPTITRAQWKDVAVLALPNMLGWHLFSILGVQALASGRAATLGFTMPIWTVLLGALFFGQHLTRRGMLAALCASVAVALLIADEFTALAGRPMGVMWMQIAAVCWALGTLMMRRTHVALPTDVITVVMMAMTSAAFWALALAVEPWPSFNISSTMGWALAWGVVVNYGVAQIIWFGLARKLPPQASTFALMAVPLVGAMTAGFIVDEPLRSTDLMAAGFVMVAIASALWPVKASAASKIGA